MFYFLSKRLPGFFPKKLLKTGTVSFVYLLIGTQWKNVDWRATPTFPIGKHISSTRNYAQNSATLLLHLEMPRTGGFKIITSNSSGLKPTKGMLTLQEL